MNSLQDRCLKIIIDEFERYHKLYSTTDDGSVLRKFEYLQRKHSEYMLDHLQMRYEIKEEYIDFLMSKYLKVIDTGWFKNCSWSTVVSKFKEIGSNIQNLNIADVYIRGFSERIPWEDIICCLPNLQSFSFQLYCCDEVLENIPKFCPNILEINLQGSYVTNEGMEYLCMKENDKAVCSSLSKLNISSTCVNDEGVKKLIKDLPSLEIVMYPNLPQLIYSMHKDDLLSLDKVVPYNIVLLEFGNDIAHAPFFTDLLNVCLSVCPHLKHLTCPLLHEEHLKCFSKLSCLETLHLECVSDSEIDINSLLESKGSKLTSLTAVKCIVSLSLLSHCCPLLKNVCLKKVVFLFNDNSKPVFHRLESCTFENLTSDPLATKNACLLLASCPKLVKISFISCNLDSPELKNYMLKCCKYNPVENIFFSRSSVKIEFVKDILLSCHSLKNLHLDECEYSIEDQEELQKFAEILLNNPCITFDDGETSSISDDDDSVQSSYNFDDEFYDEYYYGYDYQLPSDEDDSDTGYGFWMV